MNRMTSRFPMVATAVAVLVLAGSPAFAALLLPGGGPAAPDVFATGPTGAVLAVSSSSFATPGGDTGTLLTAVVEDTPGGNLNFLYQWIADAGNPDNFIATSAINYDSFSTDIGYISPAAVLSADLTAAGFVVPVGSIATPNAVQRSVSGNTVDWFFTGTAFPAGATSVILEVQTSASYFAAGVAGIQDGTTANVPAFAPVIPEPVSLLVWAGIGATVLLVRSWRKR